MFKIVQPEREGVEFEVPPEDPPTPAIAILQECVRTIDLYLDYYRNGLDGSEFRYIKQGDVHTINKVKGDRQQLIQDAKEQLEWILSDEIAVGPNARLTFPEVCDAQGIRDIPSFRKTVLDMVFHGVHRNALTTLLKFINWNENYEDRHIKRPDHSTHRRLQTQHP